jgi:acetyltransferase-like isoleucine patch superfamily enzyme
MLRRGFTVGFRKILNLSQKRAIQSQATIHKSTVLSSSHLIHNQWGNPKQILVGGNCLIGGNLRIISRQGQIRLGNSCHIGEGSELWSATEILIGDRVLIAQNVTICDSSVHSKDAKQRSLEFHAIFRGDLEKMNENIKGVESSPIIIEDDVWISFGVTILKGVTIGHGSVIGAGSVITQNIPANTVVVPRVALKTRPIE